MVLDALVANNDRHSGNWGYSESILGTKALMPVYDNGSSFGVSFGSLVWQNYTPERYMNTDLSRFGDYHLSVLRRAAVLKPFAVNTWLNQLQQIQPTQFNQIFNQIPSNRISPEAKLFAQNLLFYNQTQFLDLSRQLNAELNSEQKQRAEEIYPTVSQLFLYQRQNNQTFTQQNLEIVEGNFYRLSWDKSESILEVTAKDERGTLAKYSQKEKPVKLMEVGNINSDDVERWKQIQQSLEEIQRQQQNQRRGFRL